MSSGDHLDPVAGLGSLDDPVRRRLYDYVASCDEPGTREDAATAAGISRTLAAYHLDKLAEAGILSVSYARPADRSGPGAGRPAKRYSRTQHDLSVTVPPRDYALLAELFAEAVSGDDSGAVRSAVMVAARKTGRTGVGDAGVIDALRGRGYEPVETTDGGIELRNCPFHRLVHQHTELVCGLNLQLVQGMLEATGEPPERATLAPRDGRCCVAVRPRSTATTNTRRPRTKVDRRRRDNGR